MPPPTQESKHEPSPEKLAEPSKKIENKQPPATSAKPKAFPKTTNNTVQADKKQTDNESKEIPNEPEKTKETNKKTVTPNKKNKNNFDRFTPTRSSTTNLNLSSSASTNSTAFTHGSNTLRSSFNHNQSKSSLAKTPTSPKKLNSNSNNNKSINNDNSSSIEYASFNIKPSQYKQTGIFLPVNNLNDQKLSLFKKELSVLKLIKDDLELIVQKVRNLQKERINMAKLGSGNFNTANFELLVKTLYEFYDKTSQEMSLLNSNLTTTSESIDQFKSKLKQLLTQVKSNCVLNVAGDTSSNFEMIDDDEANSHAPNGLSWKELDSGLSALSKTFNEFMQHLDKLNCLYTQQALMNNSG
jgi:hypothetical protein